MKKAFTIILFTVACLYTGTLHAQTFQKGSGVLNLTIGLGNALYSGSGYNSGIPPLAASYEVGIVDNILGDNGSIGVGGYVGYSSYRWRYNYMGQDWGYNYTNIIIGPRGVFHYQLVDKLDTYAGILIGANVVRSREHGNVGSGYSASGGGVIYDTFLGARYYFNDSVAGALELGFGISYLNIGVALKLK